MKRIIVGLATVASLGLLCETEFQAQPRDATEKPRPQTSGFFSFFDASADFGPGIGNVSTLSCIQSQASQPSIYGGNFLIDCDGEVPHNETTIAVNPTNPFHAVGGYHSYQLIPVGATTKLHIIGTASVTFDSGNSWQEVVPPITPYEFTGDPALAFAANGRLYFANIADHEGPGGSFTGPSVVVARSDDGGLSWSNPVTVARGKGAVNGGALAQLIFQDKEYIATDTSATSPFINRAYVTWTSFRFQEFGLFSRSPIMASFSDDGVTWSEGREISGFHPACSVQFGGGASGECDEDQFSSPTVAPGGRVYAGYENFNTPAENQYMMVHSTDGGTTWSAPSRVDQISDINFPINVDGRGTLTGCQLRIAAAANIAADPSDPTGRTVYAAWADNRHGTASATNTDVFLARSGDSGLTWTVNTIDSSPNDQFYPWVAVAPDGRVDVGYMDRKYSLGQGVCQYGFTLTRLDFNTRGKIVSKTSSRVDTALSDAGHSRWFSASTNGNTRFIGDYNGVATGSDGVTWSLWTDHRNVVQNPPSPTRNHGQHAVGARRSAP